MSWFLVSWFLVLKVSKFQGFKIPLMLLKNIGSILLISHYMFLIDIDPISKVFKILLDGSSEFVGASSFQHFFDFHNLTFTEILNF